jgi:hypothetical protein
MQPNLTPLYLKQTKFNQLLEEVKKTGDFTEITKLKTEIEADLAELEHLLTPEEVKSYLEQYQTQTEIYKKLNIIQTLPDGTLGIKQENGTTYHYPTLDQVTEQLKSNLELITHKQTQGFTELKIIPQALSIKQLVDIYTNLIKTKHSEGNLKSTDGTVLNLNETTPVYTWDDQLDPTKATYYPTALTGTNHGGITKDELIKNTDGFELILTENLPKLPRENQGVTVGDRPQLSANQKVSDYFEKLQDPLYQNEQGYTTESWLIHAITHLETTNTVLDDYSDPTACAAFNLGTFFPASANVSYCYWYRGDSQAHVRRADVSLRDGDSAPRLLVRVV